MARINKNGTLSGMMGDAVLRSFNDSTYAYARPAKVRNPQTRGQMMQRTKKQNIVNLYGRMKPALKDNFQGKTGKQSDYTMFVSCNLSQQPVYLTDSEALLGATQVVAPYVVSYGKLSPIEYQLEDGWLVSNIKVSSLDLTEDAKVYDLAASIIAENEDWKEGDILEFISCRQLTKKDADGTNIVYAECDYANVVLDNAERSRLRKYLDEIQLKVNEDGYLCMSASAEGGYALVHKRPSSKDVFVGIQNMVVDNSLLDVYCSEEHCEKAIKSYEKKKQL